MITHRLAACLLLATALTACADADDAAAPTGPSFTQDAGHNSAEHIKEVNQVTFEAENPCNGEVIVFTGTEILTATFVGTEEALENGNSVHNHFHSRVDATGTGPLSGATYSIHDIFRTSFQSPSPSASHFTASFGGTSKITSSDRGLSFRFKLLVHVLLNPGTGEFKVTKEREETTCKG